jgi:hypothetical protein
VIRFLHLIAIAGLIGSAVYAYSIKYDTLYQAGQVAKLKSQLGREREAVAVLKAEWQLLTRPDRLQGMVDRLALEPIGIDHLGRLADLPARPDRGDEIGRKLEALGLLSATATPREGEPRTTGALQRVPARTATVTTPVRTPAATATAPRQR